MSGHNFSPQAYKKLRGLDEEANLNFFLSEMAKERQFLRPVWPELLCRAGHIISNHSTFLSPATLNNLKSLPSKDQQMIGLNKMKRTPTSDSSNIPGSIFFPVVTSYGHMRRIIVTEGATDALQRGHLAILDLVGSVVFKAIHSLFNVPAQWNPFDYAFDILNCCGEKETIVAGESMALPLALALASRATNQQLPSDVSATGIIQRDGSVWPIEGIDEKLQALKRECHFIKRVFISKQQQINSSNGLALIRVNTVQEAIALAFPMSLELSHLTCRIDMETENRKLEELYEAGLYDSCRERADASISYLETKSNHLTSDEAIPILFNCYRWSGSCFWRQGDVERAESYLDKAGDLYLRHRGSGIFTDYMESMIQTAVILKEMFKFERAESLHKDLDKKMKQAKVADHIRGKNLSALGQLCLAMGHYREAEAYHKKALLLIRQRSKSRSYGYLSQAYTHQGRFRAAAIALKQAHDWLPVSEPTHYQKNLSYYCYFRSEYLYKLTIESKGDLEKMAEEISRIIDQCPQIDDYIPLMINKYLGIILFRLGDEAGGLAAIDKALSFVGDQKDPMDKFYEACVRIERGLFWLKKERLSDASIELFSINNYLSVFMANYQHFNSKTKIIGNPNIINHNHLLYLQHIFESNNYLFSKLSTSFI